MSAPDDRDPQLTRAFALWAEDGVPALPDGFTAAVMADVAAQRAGAAWAEDGVPALPDGFTAAVMADVAAQRAGAAWAEDGVPALPDGFAAAVAAKAAARPKLQVVDGGAARVPAPARRWWQWPAVAVAAAAALALLSSRMAPSGDPSGTVARRAPQEAPRVAPTVDPVSVAIAEVTRVEVLGAQSVAVLSLEGEGGRSGSPVVWITDKAEDSRAGDLETRMQ
jgi:hypothetical protein